MERPLTDVVTDLLKNKKNAKSVQFGPIACQLLTCVEEMHKRKHVVVDLKPENFMLAASAKKNAKLESKIRLLDLALVQPWKSFDGHRDNEGGDMVGTPLYTSLNIHRGETISRRDDLEALGYMISELIMQLVKGKVTSDLLPWSKGKSDEEIGTLKEKYMGDSKSAFYKQLGSPTVVKVIREYMDEVQGYSFKKTPDYEKLSSILSKLNIPISKATSTTASTTSTSSNKKRSTTMTPPKTSGTKRRTRSSMRNSEDVEDEDVEEEHHKHARSGSPMDVEVIDLAESDDEEEDYHTAVNESSIYYDPDDDDDDAMDVDGEDEWEVISDENQAANNTPPQPTIGVTVNVSDGPHRGKSFTLVQMGGPSAAILGRNPSTTKGEMLVTLDQDDQLDDSHVRFELSVTGKKQLLAINLTDLKSSSGTFVGRTLTKKSRVFLSDSVQLGASVLSFQKFSGTVARPKSASKRTTQRAPRPARSSSGAIDMDVDASDFSTAPASVAKQNRTGIRVDIVQGPHMGESFELACGDIESIVFGSKPGASKNGAAKLAKDKSLGASHIRVDLVAEGGKKKKFYSVNVTDLKAGSTKVNSTALGKGKSTRAFVKDQVTVGDTVLQVNKLS